MGRRDARWHKCDDEVVTEVGDAEVRRKVKSAYVLLYARSPEQSPPGGAAAAPAAQRGHAREPCLRASTKRQLERLAWGSGEKSSAHMDLMSLEVCSGAGCEIKLGDIATLAPDGWVNDEVINEYGELLAKRLPVAYLNSHWLSMSHEPKKLRRWARSKRELSSAELIITPCHHKGNHWVLVAISSAEIHVFDSFHCDKTAKDVGAKAKKAMLEIAPGRHYEVVARKDTQRQLDGNTCGPRAIHVMDHVARHGVAATPTACESLNEWRASIAVALVVRALPSDTLTASETEIAEAHLAWLKKVKTDATTSVAVRRVASESQRGTKQGQARSGERPDGLAAGASSSSHELTRDETARGITESWARILRESPIRSPAKVRRE